MAIVEHVETIFLGGAAIVILNGVICAFTESDELTINLEKRALFSGIASLYNLKHAISRSFFINVFPDSFLRTKNMTFGILILHRWLQDGGQYI